MTRLSNMQMNLLQQIHLTNLTHYPYDTCYIGAKSGRNIVQLKQMIKEKLNQFPNYR